MAQQTLNPYPLIGKQFTIGMDYIITNVPGSTIDDLVNTVHAYINTLGYFVSSPQIDLEIKSIAYRSIDDYSNGELYNLFDEEQNSLLYVLIGPSIIDITTVDTLKERILDVERNIDNRNLTIDQQTPLLLATKMGNEAYAYWVAKLSSPGLWAPYLSTALVSPQANLQNWVVAGMEGALFGERSTEKGMINPTTDIIINKIVASLIYSLTISAGKVIFKWIPRIQVLPHQSFSIIVPRDYNSQRAIINNPPKYEPYNLRTLKVGGFANSGLSLILGNQQLENDLLQYAMDNKIYQLQLFDLRYIFGNTVYENALSDFIFKARSTYHIGNIACIMGYGKGGFIDALAYNGNQPTNRQFNIFNKENEWWSGMLIQFKIDSGQTFTDYVLEINGYPCLFNSSNSSNVSDIAIGLKDAINSNILVNLHLTATISPTDPSIILVEADTTLNQFTYNNPNTALIGIWDVTAESYADWIGSLNWLRGQINFYGYQITISAYIQNYFGNVWLPSTAADLVAVVDDIEATNYNSGIPNASSLISRIIIPVATAASAAGKVQNIRPLISAEWKPGAYYSGNYLFQNGLKATEWQWKQNYNGINFGLIKNYIKISGYSYFDYANLLVNSVVR